MAANRSYEWPDIDIAQAITSLETVLMSWTPSTPASQAFDTTVQRLIEIAIHEGHAYLNRITDHSGPFSSKDLSP